MKRVKKWGAAAVALVCASCSLAGELSIESWRSEDALEWSQLILPEFQKSHPDIHISFSPTVEGYDAALSKRLTQKAAGDLITCRPFKEDLFNDGYVEDLSSAEGLRNYRSIAKLAWTTQDRRHLFCMPVASVMHGFFYNKRIFAKLGLAVPETEAQFFRALDKIKRAGKVVPMAFGTKDAWVTNQVAFTGIGPNRWAGEEGRTALVEGRQKFTDKPYVDTWRTMARWANYMPKNYRQLKNAAAREMFVQGKAAIFPTGSWEIDYLVRNSKDEVGVFRPPVLNAGDTCYISNHMDIGIGINRASANKEEAQKFVQWLTTRQFASVLANAIPGFFPLSSHPIEIREPLGREMMNWRRMCETTIRVNTYAFNEAKHSIEEHLWRVGAEVMNKTRTPMSAAREIQKNLDSWYVPETAEGGK